jgi:GTPase SAR1 family protein
MGRAKDYSRSKQRTCRKLTLVAPGTPIILVGTKRDLREDPVQLEKLRDRRQEPISFPQGNEKAKEIKAAKVRPRSSVLASWELWSWPWRRTACG